MEKIEKIENEKKYGKVEFDGKTYILTQSAYCDNYGTDGGVRYYAHAVAMDDADDTTYKVVWDTTGDWDNHLDDCPTIVDEMCDCGYREDESNACDWDDPIDVIET